MAEDTRKSPPPSKDLSREALTVDPSAKPFSGPQWRDSTSSSAPPPRSAQHLSPPPENANVLAGGTSHTAGGTLPEVTLYNAITLPSGTGIGRIHTRPCVRDGLMTGIGAGAGIGGVRFVVSGNVWRSCNWAVGGFVCGAVGAYQWCLYRRQAEREGMNRAMEILNRKEMEKKVREQRKNKKNSEEGSAGEDVRAQDGVERGGGPGRPWWKVW